MKHYSIFYKPIFSISSSSMPHILCFTNNNVQTKLLVTSHNTSVHRDTDHSRGMTSQVQDLMWLFSEHSVTVSSVWGTAAFWELPSNTNTYHKKTLWSIPWNDVLPEFIVGRFKVLCVKWYWNPRGYRRSGRPKRTWQRTIEDEIRSTRRSWNDVKGIAGDRNAWKLFMDALCSTRSKRIWWWWCAKWYKRTEAYVLWEQDLKRNSSCSDESVRSD